MLAEEQAAYDRDDAHGAAAVCVREVELSMLMGGDSKLAMCSAALTHRHVIASRLLCTEGAPATAAPVSAPSSNSRT